MTMALTPWCPHFNSCYTGAASSAAENNPDHSRRVCPRPTALPGGQRRLGLVGSADCSHAAKGNNGGTVAGRQGPDRSGG
jgi:hypothetical protein